jgi:hypothetical protein
MDSVDKELNQVLEIANSANEKKPLVPLELNEEGEELTAMFKAKKKKKKVFLSSLAGGGPEEEEPSSFSKQKQHVGGDEIVDEPYDEMLSVRCFRFLNF